MSSLITPAAARTIAALCGCSSELALNPDREQEFFPLQLADFDLYRPTMAPHPSNKLLLLDPRGIERATFIVESDGSLSLKSATCSFQRHNIVAAAEALALAAQRPHTPKYLAVLVHYLPVAVQRHAAS